MATGEERAYAVYDTVLAYVQDHRETLFKSGDGYNGGAMADFIKSALADVNHPARAYKGPRSRSLPIPKGLQMEQFLTLFPVKL